MTDTEIKRNDRENLCALITARTKIRLRRERERERGKEGDLVQR